MSSGMNFMYGHVFGAHGRKPHIETVRAIRRSNVDPYITSPFGVDPAIARPGPRNTPFVDDSVSTSLPALAPVPSQVENSTQSIAPDSNNDIDDIINMITSDPDLKSKEISKGKRIIQKTLTENE